MGNLKLRRDIFPLKALKKSLLPEQQHTTTLHSLLLLFYPSFGFRTDTDRWSTPHPYDVISVESIDRGQASSPGHTQILSEIGIKIWVLPGDEVVGLACETRDEAKVDEGLRVTLVTSFDSSVASSPVPRPFMAWVRG